MEVIYSGFDGLDVSYQGLISDAFLNQLEEAQQLAIKAREPALLNYAGIALHVTESGARGGYAFRCDTGPVGATWFFKRPNPKDPWGIRVSVKSLALAVHGLEGAREQIEATLNAFGCRLHARPESIGRVDYAVDILAPGFELRPQNFVMHARSTRADHEEIETRQSHGRSGRYTSVTIGKNPGRQIIVYDKRMEAIQKPDKRVWFDIWNKGKEKAGQAPLDFADNFASAVWRVEIRLYKKALKDRNEITTWNDLTAKLKSSLLEALEKTRYAVPAADGNRSRWVDHGLWQLARSKTAELNFKQTGPLDSNGALKACRTSQLKVIDQQLVGLAASRVALEGNHMQERRLEEAVSPIKSEIELHPASFENRVLKAHNRYRHICETT